jgi:hypothetical protein
VASPNSGNIAPPQGGYFDGGRGRAITGTQNAF